MFILFRLHRLEKKIRAEKNIKEFEDKEVQSFPLDTIDTDREEKALTLVQSACVGNPSGKSSVIAATATANNDKQISLYLSL